MSRILEKELDTARSVAREAGLRLMEFYRTDYQVQWKGHDDPVTVADHAANELIVEELRRAFPADAVLSEEFPDDLARLSNDRVWMVDPMDGTKQFIDHVDEFAVMIGLSVGRSPMLGVVYNPAREKMYYAAAGMGAFVEEKWSTKRLRVASTSDPGRMTVALSRSHHSPRVDSICAALGVEGKVRQGSVGLKFGLLAEGIAHLYIHLGDRTNQWDSCGPEAILREAGGVITDTRGAAIEYNGREIRNRRGIVASNGPLHDRIIRVIEQSMRPA